MDSIQEHTIISIIATELADFSDEDRRAWLATPWDDLIKHHNGYGRYLRNTYELWSYEWEPLVEDGVDYSPNHPDAVSQLIIQRIWSQLQTTMR